MSNSDSKIRSMANLLRSGATLTDLSCPACSSPLFRMRNGELWCAQCQRKVVVVKEDEQVEETRSSAALDVVESTLLAKIGEINERMQGENNLEELQRLSAAMTNLLENLERVRRIGRYKT